MPRIAILPAAVRDLYEQAVYLADHAGTETADRWVERTTKTFEFLLGSPTIGAPYEFRRRNFAGMRTWPVDGFKNQIVFYRPVADGIEIVRVLRGSRDIERVLDE